MKSNKVQRIHSFGEIFNQNTHFDIGIPFTHVACRSNAVKSNLRGFSVQFYYENVPMEYILVLTSIHYLCFRNFEN